MTHPESPNKVSEVEVKVEIMDLKYFYDKKTKKPLEGLEYRLEDSKVTVVVQASDVITSVEAYTQICQESAIRTHDTIDKVLIFLLVNIFNKIFLIKQTTERRQ